MHARLVGLFSVSDQAITEAQHNTQQTEEMNISPAVFQPAIKQPQRYMP